MIHAKSRLENAGVNIPWNGPQSLRNRLDPLQNQRKY